MTQAIQHLYANQQLPVYDDYSEIDRQVWEVVQSSKSLSFKKHKPVHQS